MFLSLRKSLMFLCFIAILFPVPSALAVGANQSVGATPLINELLNISKILSAGADDTDITTGSWQENFFADGIRELKRIKLRFKQMKPGSTEMKTADAKEALEQLDALATLVHETSAVLVSVIDGPTDPVYRSGDHALALYFDLYEYGKYLGSARSEVGTWIKRTEFKSRMPQPVRDGRPLFDGDNSQIPEPIRIKETPQPVFSPEERKAMVQRGAELVKVQAQYSAEARKLATALRIAASELDQAMQNRESSTEKAMQNLATAVRMLDDAGDQRSKLLGDAMEYSKELFREFARDDEKVLDGQSKENRVQDRTSEMADKLKSGEPEPLDDYVDKEFGDKSSDKLHQSIDEERKKNPDSTVPRTEKSPEGNQPTKPIDPDLAGSEPSAGSETVDNPFGPLDL